MKRRNVARCSLYIRDKFFPLGTPTSPSYRRDGSNTHEANEVLSYGQKSTLKDQVPTVPNFHLQPANNITAFWLSNLVVVQPPLFSFSCPSKNILRALSWQVPSLFSPFQFLGSSIGFASYLRPTPQILSKGLPSTNLLVPLLR